MTPSPRILPHLDSVRGLAALLVFINHVEWVKVIHGLPNWNHLPFIYNCGMLGVNLFFVLSGFLITHLLLREQTEHGTIDIGAFYVRRILRIWPLYFALTLLAFFVLPHWLSLPGLRPPLEQPVFGRELTLFLGMLPNVAYVTLPLVPFASPLWSVGVEEQFYAFWPWLLRACHRFLLPALLAIVVAMPMLRAWAWHGYQANPGPGSLACFHFLDFFRIQCMALGALAATVGAGRSASLQRALFHPVAQWTAAVVAVGVHLCSRDLFGPVHSEVMAAAHALLLLNLALNPACIFSLQNRWLDYLGRVSYGFYLLHLPAIALVVPALRPHLEGMPFALAVWLAAGALALFFASVSYFCYERFFLRLKARFASRPAGDKSAAAVRPGFSRWISAAIAGALLLPSLLWIALDETVWPWDPAWYGEVATDLWWTLGHAPAHWSAQMLSAFGTKAPGAAWIGQFFAPLGQGLGSIEFGLLFSTWLAAAGSLLLLARAGRACWRGDARGGWLAMLVAGAAPLFVGMSHQFMVEALQTFGVAYFYWIALCAGDRSRVALLGHALLAGALVMLAKVTSPLYCGLVVLLVAARLWRAPRFQAATLRARWLERGLLLLGTLLLTAAGLWYAHNAETMREFIQLASFSAVALEYGRLPEFWAKWRFWGDAFSGALVLPWSGALLAGLLGVSTAVAAWRRAVRAHLDPWQAATALAAVLTIIGTLYTFTRQINEETRYLLPLAPSLAILVTVLAGLPAARGAWFGVFAAVLAAQAVVVHGAALRLWPRPAAANVWLLPYEPDKQPKRDVMGVVKRTTTTQTMNRIHVNTYETPWLNANSLAFYAAKHRLRVDYRCYYTSLGYAATDLEAAWARVESMQAASLIALVPARQDPVPNFLNKIALPALQRAQTTPAYAPLDFPNPSGILIYARRF
jgi:peptidoglycan/LPS O-acetylase OafA/YrhL